MATEVEKPPSFPKYPEMILEAIGQDPKEGVKQNIKDKVVHPTHATKPHGNVVTKTAAKAKNMLCGRRHSTIGTGHHTGVGTGHHTGVGTGHSGMGHKTTGQQVKGAVQAVKHALKI